MFISLVSISVYAAQLTSSYQNNISQYMIHFIYNLNDI